MSFKQVFINFLRISSVVLLFSIHNNLFAQQKVSYAWVDSLLSTKNVLAAKSKLDSIYLLHKDQLEPEFYFKKARVYYDLFMQSTMLIGVQDNQWLLESLSSYNVAINSTYKKIRITDVQLDRLKLNRGLALKYVNLKAAPNKTDIQLMLQALQANKLWATISKQPIDNAPVYRALASLYLRSGKAADAIGYLEDLFEEESSSFIVFDLINLTDLYRQEGDYKKAWKRFSWFYGMSDEVETLDRNVVLSDWVEMSVINSMDSLLIVFLIDSSRFNDAYEYFVIASLYEVRRQTTSAEVYYLKSIEADSSLLDASYNLGILYYNQASAINKMLTAGVPQDQISTLTAQRQQLYLKALPLFIASRSLNPETCNKLIKYLQQATATQ